MPSRFILDDLCQVEMYIILAQNEVKLRNPEPTNTQVMRVSVNFSRKDALS